MNTKTYRWGLARGSALIAALTALAFSPADPPSTEAKTASVAPTGANIFTPVGPSHALPAAPRLTEPAVPRAPEVMRGAPVAQRSTKRPDGPQSGPQVVRVHKDDKGYKLLVDGEPTMVFGMNWGYMPIGENYSYDFWGKPDEFIIDALESEMTLLKDMGVNVIRLYVGVPQRWITYMYEKYGIFTVLNHPMGRYGFTMNGVWTNPTNYADDAQRAYLKNEIMELIEAYRDTPGLLFWLLGNENNYGLYWSSAEIEDLPLDNQNDARAKFLYSLYGEIIDGIHERDDKHPVAIANGDLQFIDLIAKHAPNLDIMGSNVYRGPRSGKLFEEVEEKLGVPFVYTEFGSDAYNAKEMREDDVAQAVINHSLWQEIYEQSHGKGQVGNAIGGMVFQWSDGWWKYKQTENLDQQDNTASWSNKAYMFDWTEDGNNMNEEWFGICAKGPNDERGLYQVYPRTSYYVLREAFKLDPYAETTTAEVVRGFYNNIRPKDLSKNYEITRVSQKLELFSMIRTANLVLELNTFTTSGKGLDSVERSTRRFGHTQSAYMEFEVQPTSNVRATVSVNVLGNVAVNPIDEIFFENRLDQVEISNDLGGGVTLEGVERIKLYQATFEWRDTFFDVEGFYRSGHGHWGYEGDFFAIFPEAYYQPTIDMFNANAPSGFIFTGKRFLRGLKIAVGPELWWGANPTAIAKYHRKTGPWEYSLIHQEDIAQLASAGTSSVLPVPRTRKTAAYLGYKRGPFHFELGGLMAGTDRLGRKYQAVRDAEPGQASYLDSGYFVLDDEIELIDTFGGKAKVTYTGGVFNAYVQGAYRGLVADSGWNNTPTFTGWSLTESGAGNNYNVVGGTLFNVGQFQIAPSFLYQKPLEGPLPLIDDFFDSNTGTYYPGVNARNQFDDPFWVRGNRETVGFELLLAHDPTPATWLWAWDTLQREDAPFAAMLDFVYRVLPTSQDGGVAIAAEGFPFAFASAAPAKNLWEVRGRIFVNPTPKLRLVSDFYAGIAQATGDDDRTITRAGIYGRMMYEKMSLEAWVKLNDWGPYDYHRDFNLTFPVQMIADFNYGTALPKWFVRAQTRMGVRAKLRFLDENSNRFGGDASAPWGHEVEVMSYVQFSL